MHSYHDLLPRFLQPVFFCFNSAALAASLQQEQQQAVDRVAVSKPHLIMASFPWHREQPFQEHNGDNRNAAFNICITDYHLERQLRLWQMPTTCLPTETYWSGGHHLVEYDLTKLDQQECLLAHKTYMACQTAEGRRTFRLQQSHWPQLDHFVR